MKTLAALAVAGFLTLFSCAPQKVEAPAAKQEQDAHSWARKLRPALYKIGLESTIDDIERGGVGVMTDDGIAIYEIDNDIRSDEERFKKYKDGDNNVYGILTSNISMASMTASGCMPALTQSYRVTEFDLQTRLSFMLNSTGEQREKIGKDLWPVYDQFVRHSMYVRDTKQYEKIKEQHPVIFYFHTHPNGSSGSLVDKQLSHDRIEIVVSITGNKYQLFYLKNGKEELIDSYEPALALKD